jgi:hypothetical protein
LKSANFIAGTLLMFCGGLIQTGTLALVPTMLQNLMNYPALTTGLVTVAGLADENQSAQGAQHADRQVGRVSDAEPGDRRLAIDA